MREKQEEPKVAEKEADLSPENNKEKHVRFQGDLKDAQSRPIKPRLTRSGERIKMGTGKANPVRDISILLTIFGILFVMTWDFGGKEESDKKEEEPSLSPKKKRTEEISKFKQFFDRRMNEHVEKNRRREHCSLYLASSSVLDAGFGVFAGQDYAEGDLVMETPMLLPLSLENASDVSLPPHAFLLKHHPHLMNVNGTLVSSPDTALNQFELKALRPIQAGEELFVPFAQHPQSVLGRSSHFPVIPTEREYTLADEILLDAQSTSMRMRVSHQRRRFEIDTGFIFNFAHRTVSHFDSDVARLLPTTKQEFDRRPNGPASLSTLKNKTLVQLQFEGQCLTDAKLHKEENKASGASVVVQRRIKKGETVFPVPLHVMKHTATCSSEGKECSWSESHVARCFSNKHSSLLFCPLTLAGFLNEGSGDTVNVEFQWHQRKMTEMTVDEILASPAGTLSLNVVALRDIEAGEELRMEAGSGSVSSRAIKDELIPDRWNALS